MYRSLLRQRVLELIWTRCCWMLSCYVDYVSVLGLEVIFVISSGDRALPVPLSLPVL